MDLELLWEVVRAIPVGRVMSYGDVGQALRNPMSGFLVGRRMRSSPSDVPWWRVVAKNGTLPVGKLDPHLECLQSQRLRQEGVEIQEGRIDMHRFGWR